jgi:predicted dehydrogenase
MINVVVIGLGHNGLAFCERYQKNTRANLVGVCDIDAGRQDYAVRQYNVKAYKYDEIFADKSIDLISIHTSDNRHKEPFIKAVEGGFNVFVEKPMADREEDVLEMARIAAKGNKVYAVGHILRFDKYFQGVKKIIEAGALGDIFYVECDYIHDLRYQAKLEPWKLAEEIPVLGGGCHPIDLLRWYAGNITEVASFSNNIAFPAMKHDSSMVTMLKFDSGCIGKVTSLYGCVSPMPERYNLSIYGTKGTIIRGRMCLDGLGHDWMEIPAATDYSHDYMPEIDHVIDCIIKGEPALVTPYEAYRTCMTGLYAEKSAVENKIMVVPCDL